MNTFFESAEKAAQTVASRFESTPLDFGRFLQEVENQLTQDYVADRKAEAREKSWSQKQLCAIEQDAEIFAGLCMESYLEG